MSQQAQSQSSKQSVASNAAKAAGQAVSTVASGAASAAKSLKTYSGMSTNRFIAVAIWLIGAWLTANTLKQLGVPDVVNVVVGGLIQLALTRAEAPLWSGRGMPKMGIAAVIVDIGVNSAGAWPYTKNIGKTDFWQMIKDVSNDPNLTATVGTQFAFALIVGAFTAAAAEYFWNEN